MGCLRMLLIHKRARFFSVAGPYLSHGLPSPHLLPFQIKQRVMYPVELSGRVERGSITNQREESVEMRCSAELSAKVQDSSLRSPSGAQVCGWPLGHTGQAEEPLRS